MNCYSKTNIRNTNQINKYLRLFLIVTAKSFATCFAEGNPAVKQAIAPSYTYNISPSLLVLT